MTTASLFDKGFTRTNPYAVIALGEGISTESLSSPPKEDLRSDPFTRGLDHAQPFGFQLSASGGRLELL